MSQAASSFATTSSLVIDPSNPQSGASCSSLGGSWQGEECDLAADAAISQGVTVTVSGGAELNVERGSVLNDSGSLTIQGGEVSVMGGVNISTQGLIQVQGTLTIAAGGTIAVAGLINSTVGTGQIHNMGTIDDLHTGSILVGYVRGTPYLGAYFINDGSLQNQGLVQILSNFTNGVEGTVENAGAFVMASATVNSGDFTAPFDLNQGSFSNLQSGEVIIQGPTFNTTGSFSNSGSFVDKQGVYGIVNNVGQFSNHGLVNNTVFFVNADGVFSNYGTFANVQGACAIQTCGTLSNTGIFVNERGGVVNNSGNLGDSNPSMGSGGVRRFDPTEGTFQNQGTLNNFQVLLNAVGGTLENSGNLSNTGTFRNLWNVTNSGGFYSSGTVVNQGNMTNAAGGTFTNERLVSNYGTIFNSGSWYASCGGVMNGNGTLLGNPVSSSPTCPEIPVPAPQFPATGALPLTLISVIGAAVALARSIRPRSTPRAQGT